MEATSLRPTGPDAAWRVPPWEPGNPRSPARACRLRNSNSCPRSKRPTEDAAEAVGVAAVVVEEAAEDAVVVVVVEAAAAQPIGVHPPKRRKATKIVGPLMAN